ncbi:amidohydrolase [Neiella marina]|uniref:Amidohydrolase n=1 Tax=Neiella holothuriorum TaxID=2870530 RepID=A0ABS7EE50_9GAMM|nr:amidohydrolase [Neiella holothuriorum]MBW8190624.1 amidohydrolase [Neiella holothuriorum]
MTLTNYQADIAIENAYILPMNGQPPINNGVILIKGSKILMLGEAAHIDSWRAKRVINANKSVVMPGFVNCHTHIASNVLLRGLNEDAKLFEWLQHMWKLKRNFDPEILYWASLAGLIEMIRAGTTSFNEHFDAYAVSPQIRALEQLPMRATLGYGFADRGLYSPITDYSWKALEQFADKVEKHHQTQDGRLHVALSPHATYSCGEKMWRLCRQVANELKITIHTHMAEGVQELKYVGERYGTTPAQWFASMGILGPDVTLAHCTKLNAEDIRLLADSESQVAHCPISNAKLCSGNMPIKEMLEAGVNIGLATDGPASHNTLDMFQEMKFAAIIHKNNYNDPELLPLKQMLELATSKSARAMHRPETGYLAEGMAADMIIVDINRPHTTPVYSPEAALVYSSRADDVRYTIVDGKILMDDRKIVGVDEFEVLTRLRTLALDLKQRSL